MKVIHDKYKAFALFSIFLSTSLLAQTESSFQVQPASLEIKSGGNADISVDVFVPEDKHLYVKKVSALSFNIPTEFSTKTKGFSVIIKEAPSSEKKGEDYILPGKGSTKAGTYVLTVFETGGRNASKLATNVALEIKTQWCITASEKCLEPKTIKKNISITVSGDKQASPGVKSRSVGGGVQWISSLNTAKSNAANSKQNIFAIVTAPEWCGYCQHLETEVFAKDSVIKTLNSKFIPLQVLDTSGDLNKFKFEGYPTMFIMDSKGKFILSDFAGSDEKSFLAAIKKYESSATTDNNSPLPSTINIEASSFSYVIKQKVSFQRNADGSWTQSSGSEASKLTEIRRDENFIIVRNDKDSQTYALPAKGKKAYILKNSQWELLDTE
ncbi:thioredoxin family protein [Leptospira idonii]|uniref:DUF255 domain-containing protein n=1 Tax=Leptospira idonii TaxID=1193500 RepID=A0A4R9M1U5_9LEPT|nr:thioredoxin family protein [Leptospira idonii]TGN19815.1 DUF255 domain-containing protein [Leptospira idonii]